MSKLIWIGLALLGVALIQVLPYGTPGALLMLFVAYLTRKEWVEYFRPSKAEQPKPQPQRPPRSSNEVYEDYVKQANEHKIGAMSREDWDKLRRPSQGWGE
ncbi:MAG TPA: hypothetical protein VND94_18735 [Terriglobia bacterium]|nr:hypothetical protein [Terriglobia bacterium]